MKNDEPLESLLRRASPADDGDARSGACLDPETLASWADGTLTGTERRTAEAHAADCARCLAMVAAMATTAPPPAEAGRPTWSPIRWLLPLTTAAVAVTAWLVVRPAEPPAISTAPESDVAGMAKPTETLSGAETGLRERAESRPADQPAPRRKASPPTAEPTAPPTAAPTAPPTAAPTAPPTAAAVPPAQPVTELKDERQQAFARSAQLSGVIMSPDPNVRWRLSGPTVERSEDGGATWQAQQTGAAADVIAGASPSRDVVWIVGRAGTVLRSEDGATWQRLDFPDETADLVSVTASDAVRATVTTSAGRTYTTTDGGRTWTLQERRPAPF